MEEILLAVATEWFVDAYVCRECGDADGIANIAPTVRFVKGIRLEDGSLRAELEAALEVDDSWDGLAWQCQSCGTEGHTIEDVVEEA